MYHWIYLIKLINSGNQNEYVKQFRRDNLVAEIHNEWKWYLITVDDIYVQVWYMHDDIYLQVWYMYDDIYLHVWYMYDGIYLHVWKDSFYHLKNRFHEGTWNSPTLCKILKLWRCFFKI